MSKCNYCGNNSLFLKVDQNGFCTQCAESSYKLMFTAPIRLKQISESLDIVSTSNNADTVASRLEFIIECAQEFQDFEEKGIKSLEPPPSKIIQVITREHDKYMALALDREFTLLITKIQAIKTQNAKINKIHKFISRLIGFKGQLYTPAAITDIEQKANFLLQQIESEKFANNKPSNKQETDKNLIGMDQDVSEKLCLKCKSKNPIQAKFCGNCGNKFL